MSDSHDPIGLFKMSTLDFFDALFKDPSIDRQQLANVSGEIGKYLMKHAVSLSAKSDVKDLKHMDFVMVPHDMLVGIREMARDYEDKQNAMKEKAH